MSKKPEGKYDPTLVPQKFIEMISRVREYGISKHGNRDDWLTTHPNEHYKSAMRHLLAAIDGEEYDESGFPHIGMAACNLMFEIVRENYKFSKTREVDLEQDNYDEQLLFDFEPNDRLKKLLEEFMPKSDTSGINQVSSELADELTKITRTNALGDTTILEQNLLKLGAEKNSNWKTELDKNIEDINRIVDKLKALRERRG